MLYFHEIFSKRGNTYPLGVFFLPWDVLQPSCWKTQFFLPASSARIFRQINCLVISLDSKTIAFTKFLRKKREREFMQSLT